MQNQHLACFQLQLIQLIHHSLLNNASINACNCHEKVCPNLYDSQEHPPGLATDPGRCGTFHDHGMHLDAGYSDYNKAAA